MPWGRVRIDARARVTCIQHGLAQWFLFEMPRDDGTWVSLTEHRAVSSNVSAGEVYVLFEAILRAVAHILRPAPDFCQCLLAPGSRLQVPVHIGRAGVVRPPSPEILQRRPRGLLREAPPGGRAPLHYGQPQTGLNLIHAKQRATTSSTCGNTLRMEAFQSELHQALRSEWALLPW